MATVKTMRICFKKPDPRAGQMVELDEEGARRAIENGEADEADDEDWALYQKQLAQAEHTRAPAPATTAKKASRGK